MNLLGKRRDDSTRNEANRFESVVAPHLEAGLNLARWLVANRQDAEDALQNAAVKAFRALAQFHGNDSKAWFLAIVRNECMDCMRDRSRQWGREFSFDEELDGLEQAAPFLDDRLHQVDFRERLLDAIDALPAPLREVLLLREMEDMTYHQIATVIDKPIGTVMSRLARARSAVARAMAREEEAP